MTAESIMTLNCLRVERLIERIQETSQQPEPSKAALVDSFRDLSHDLEEHTEIITDRFYPALEQHPEARLIFDRIFAEHQEIAQCLGKLEHLPLEAPVWLEDLQRLKERFAAHVSIERRELIPQLKGMLPSSRVDQSGPYLPP